MPHEPDFKQKASGENAAKKLAATVSQCSCQDVLCNSLSMLLQDDKVAVRERYLGLHKPNEADVPLDHAEQLGQLVEKHVDLDRLLEVAGKAKVPTAAPAEREESEGPRPRIAVAKDDAFCFYYAE